MCHYLYEYKTFDSTAELNNAVYLHIRDNTYQLNETDRTTIKMVARYAVKFAGAAHLKAETIANLIGKSVKTARRTINKLVELGIVEKVATTRKVNGGKGANIITILPVPSLKEMNVISPDDQARYSPNDQSTVTNRRVDETATDNKAETRKSGKEPSDSIKQLSTTYLDTNPLPSNALRSALPSAVYSAMSPFFNADEIYKYYGLLLKAKRKTCPNTLIEHDPEPYIEAINAVLFKHKQGIVRNLESYLYVAFEKAAATVARRNTEEDGILSYNWLVS